MRDFTPGMRTLFWSSALAIVLGSTGCAGIKRSEPVFQPVPGLAAEVSATTPEPAAPSAPAPTPAAVPVPASTPVAPGTVSLVQGLIGKVSSANENLKFVVITFPVGRMAAVDSRLNVYRAGLKVGELTVTGPQREESTVADITAGMAQVGDEVRDR